MYKHHSIKKKKKKKSPMSCNLLAIKASLLELDEHLTLTKFSIWGGGGVGGSLAHSAMVILCPGGWA